LPSNELNSVKIGSTVWAWEFSKIWGHKKKLKTTRVIFHPCAGTPPLGRLLWILVWGWCRRRNHPCQILC